MARDGNGQAPSDRVPPQDLEAEQATLGAMLLGGDAVGQVAELISPTDFYRDAHRFVCEACLSLFDRGEPIDIVSVAAELRSGEKLDRIGGFEYLDRLVRVTPFSSNVERYARVVKEKALLRALLQTSQQIAGWCFDPDVTPQDAMDRAEASVMGLAQERSTFDFEHVNPITARVFEEAEQKFYHGNASSGVPTGYPDLDEYLAGFQKSDLVILGARPSMGKTSLAVCFAMHAALRRDNPTPVGIFSLEMSKEQLVSGMICTQARVDLTRWRSGRFKQDDWTNITEAINELSKAPIYIDDTPAMSPREVRAKARRLKHEHNLGMIVLDYLQMMRGSGHVESRINEISEISRSLKALAKELDIPVIACAQLSRGVESRPNKRPMLSDLRESGQIEADADVVMFLYRDSYYRQKESGGDDSDPYEQADPNEPDPTEVIIAKQRSGPTGTVELGFLRHYKRFVNMASGPHG